MDRESPRRGYRRQSNEQRSEQRRSQAPIPRRRSREHEEKELYEREVYEDDLDDGYISEEEAYQRAYVPRRRASASPSRPPRRAPATIKEPRSHPAKHQRPRRHRRSALPSMALGCVLGIVLVIGLAVAGVLYFIVPSLKGNSPQSINPFNNVRAHTKEESVTAALTSLAQLQVCTKIGNVSLLVDPKATQVTVTSKKTVQASSDADAQQKFTQIKVEVQPPANITTPLTCTRLQESQSSQTGNSASGETLIVNVVFPTTTNNMMNSVDEAADITIRIPPSTLPANPTLQVNVEAPVGNITVEGLSGVLNLHGNTGAIKVTQSILASGSRLETGQKGVTFNGLLLVPPTATANNPALYSIRSEQGNLDITLPGNLNLRANINTNVGSIKSDFPFQPQKDPQDENSMSYSGPLNPQAGAPAPATLNLDVSIGNIVLHKLQTS
ncbi:hypothetical protein [Ktedonospora formicarum]|uniref:hypothetical protein n=1 Tax=Ktedonospora formicarum TaxID=2778364 RepID=UPI001C690915|nr:hypothetical protein [Ktedonospora formicarum]